ncbi:MAG: domain S-box [Fibrobacteres bacterium]|nr:domain S-box [Fibrobacterota bacterium]
MMAEEAEKPGRQEASAETPGRMPGPELPDSQLELLRLAVQHAPLILSVYDKEFRFRLLMGGALGERGMKENQLVGLDAREVLKDNPELLASLEKAKQGHTHRWLGERTGVYLEAYVSPIFDGKGEFNGLVSMALNVTDRVKAQAEVLRLNAELEAKIKERTGELEEAIHELEAFSYSVSHDLRAPLRHIGGFLELLLKKSAASLDDQGRRYLGIISDSAKRMDSLITDLLSFSRVNRQERLSLRFSMAELTAQVIHDLDPDLQGREVEWTVGELPDAVGDLSMIRQVMANLLANAVKFTLGRQPARIEIGALAEDEGKNTYFVRDNGAGFEMKYYEKLFGIFQRLHGAAEFEGTGIGLANVRRIVHRHGGTVWAEGAVGRGATFSFTLPAPPVPKPAP